MPRVLLVDDDIGEISAVKRVITRAGHQPVLATNSADAMIAVDQERPDLLVISATCESGEGLTLARALRHNPPTADIPLIVLGDADSLPKGARRVPRPVDPELFTTELSGALPPSAGIAIAIEEPAPADPPPRPAAAAARAPGKAPAAPSVTALGAAAPARPGGAPAAPSRPAAAKPAAPRTAPPRPGAAAAGPARAAAPGVGAPRPGAVAIGRLLTSQPPAREEADGSAPSDPPPPPKGAKPAPGPSKGLPAQGPGDAAPPPRAGLSDAAASRRAAAEALRARAEELRRSSQRAPRAADVEAAPGSAPRPAPGLASDSVPKPSPVLIAPLPAEPPAPSLAESLDLGDLDSTLRKAEAAGYAGDAGPGAANIENARRRAAEEALRALEEEASTHAAEVARSRRAAAEAAAAAAAAAAEAAEAGSGGAAAPERSGSSEPRGAAEERALQEAIETARREAFEAAKHELQEQARKEAAEAARLIQAEARARQEAMAAAEREARDLAHREAEARERAQSAERELEALRSQLEEQRWQLEEERRKAEERVATVMQRAAQEEEAAEESSRSRAAEEQKLRDAIASARTEMEELRRKHQEEARRREEVEYALRRLEGARRGRVADGASEEAPPEFHPPAFFAPFDGAEPAEADPAEETARRRVAAFRAGEPEGVEPTSRAPARGPDLDGEADGAGGSGAEASFADEPARTLSPPLPQLRAGNLSELPAPRLLALAARARLDGRLDFRGDMARSIWFEEGRVVGASSADPSERVEEVALRLGLITREQYRHSARSAAALPSRRAAMLLLERGFLKPTELTGLVRRRTEEVVFGVFADGEALFRWTGVEVPPEERTGLERGTLALAVEGVRRRWLGPRVDALLGGPATLLAPAQGGPALAELGLSADERRVVALADGLRALEEILQESPLDALSTRQVLAALVTTGALSVRALQAGRPSAHAAAAIDLARVRDKLEQVRRADYFTVLGVGRLCTPHEVREAAERLQREFDPGRHASQGDEGLPARLAEILQVVNDAREVLADDRLRDEYLRGLGEPG